MALMIARPNSNASVPGYRRSSRRSRGRSCGRASRPRRISPAAGRAGTWNRPGRRSSTCMIARQVSRPMKSASSSGPIGMVGAQLHGRVDGLDRADALIQRVDRLVDHRHQDAVDDEGREVLRRRRGLAQLGRRDRGSAWNVGSSVAMPRISSTSFITGTGFMKCMPMNRSGRSVTAARRVIEMRRGVGTDDRRRASDAGTAP